MAGEMSNIFKEEKKRRKRKSRIRKRERKREKDRNQDLMFKGKKKWKLCVLPGALTPSP